MIEAVWFFTRTSSAAAVWGADHNAWGQASTKRQARSLLQQCYRFLGRASGATPSPPLSFRRTRVPILLMAREARRGSFCASVRSAFCGRIRGFVVARFAWATQTACLEAR